MKATTTKEAGACDQRRTRRSVSDANHQTSELHKPHKQLSLSFPITWEELTSGLPPEQYNNQTNTRSEMPGLPGFKVKGVTLKTSKLNK